MFSILIGAIVVLAVAALIAELIEMAERKNGRPEKLVKCDSIFNSHFSKNKGPVPDCISCEQDMWEGECTESKKPCGHHCNHCWTQDKCCYCGEEFGAV